MILLKRNKIMYYTTTYLSSAAVDRYRVYVIFEAEVPQARVSIFKHIAKARCAVG